MTPSAILVLGLEANIRLPFVREGHKEQLLAVRGTYDNAGCWGANRGGASLQLDKGLVHCSTCH